MTDAGYFLVMVALMLVAGFLGYLAGQGAHVRHDCGKAIHTSPRLCAELGGVMDNDGDGSTVCLFTCTIPP